jgi:hypothetical protein
MFIDYTRKGDMKGFTSGVITGGPEDEEIAREIYRQRGLLYDPETYGGMKTYIADTDIRFVGPDLKSPAETIDELYEYHPVWDDLEVPDHALKRTAKILIRNSGNVVASGWLVPYSPDKGIPMENRIGEQTYSWDDYFHGKDEYLQEHGIELIDPMKAIEIGRFSNIDGPLAFKLMIRTVYRFLKDLGVDDYFDAAIDHYATLYEFAGNRRVGEYYCDTVTSAEAKDGVITPKLSKLKYWSQHNHVPLSEEMARNGDIGNPGDANINLNLIRFIAPELFEEANQRV